MVWFRQPDLDRIMAPSPKSLWKVTAVMKLKDTCSLEEKPVPVPASKVDQVPRTCTAGLRKETKVKEIYNKDGVERFRHVSTKGCSLTPTLFSISYLYRRA